MGAPIDMTGKRFGTLCVLGLSPDTGKGKKPVVKWLCRCDCGKTVAVKGDSLRSGHTKSCGCGKVKHGESHKKRLYETWCNMKARCYNGNRPDFERYGGRGIRVCGEWREDYTAFRDWALAAGYSDSLTIDRIDPDGDYCPENCRWADAKTQANNVRRNRVIEYLGERKTMSEWAEDFGLSYSAMQHRVECGWPMERIAEQAQRGR